MGPAWPKFFFSFVRRSGPWSVGNSHSYVTCLSHLPWGCRFLIALVHHFQVPHVPVHGPRGHRGRAGTYPEVHWREVAPTQLMIVQLYSFFLNKFILISYAGHFVRFSYTNTEVVSWCFCFNGLLFSTLKGSHIPISPYPPYIIRPFHSCLG